MARASLGNLLSVASDQGTAKPPNPSSEPQSPGEVVNPAAKATQPAMPRKPTRQAAKPAQGAYHWTEYERLEARLRDEQVAKLDVLTRRLNKRRLGAGERITKNSLLRVAVDLLLECEGDLVGTTEAEILASLQRGGN